MGKIVAIGGGELKRPGQQVSTTTVIDREIIRLSGEKNPKFLFVPTASSDSEKYVSAVQRHFGDELRCIVDVLYLIRDPSFQQISAKIQRADIIYVGGGNTLKKMRR